MLDIQGRSSSINICEFNEKLVCVNLRNPSDSQFLHKKDCDAISHAKRNCIPESVQKTVLIYESFAIYTQNFEI